MQAAPSKSKLEPSHSPEQPKHDEDKYRPGVILAHVANFLAWQLVAVMLVEAVLWSAHIGEEEIFNFDPVLGCVHMSNKDVTWRQEGPGAHSHFDSDGMRETNLSLAKPKDTYRVAVLGDSQVEGMQVPIEDTFTNIASKDLTAEFKPQFAHVQVLNFGTSGYSTAQEYLQLKRKVFKYDPDLVVLGYSSRDLFENWSPPDQAVTNVRPYALQLPGNKLVVDSTPVTQWLKTPRARFLMQISWLRQNSHIWGFLSAEEQRLTLGDSTYKWFVSLINKPGKTLKALPNEWIDGLKAGLASFSMRKSKPASLACVTAPNLATAPVIATSPSSITASSSTAPAKNAKFIELVSTTMSSLLDKMNNECAERQVKFSVLILPSRSSLLPDNVEEDRSLLPYRGEAIIVNKLCNAKHIPIVDAEVEAEKLSPEDRKNMYFTAHLRPFGHTFVSRQIEKLIASQIK